MRTGETTFGATRYPEASGWRKSGLVWNQQVVEELYVERTVTHPGLLQCRPLDDRDDASFPRSGGPNTTPRLVSDLAMTDSFRYR